MKNLSKILLATAGAAMLSLGWSCNKPQPEPEPEPTLDVKLVATQDTMFKSSSAAFEVQSTHIESYVFTVEEGENLPSPDPAMLYAEAKEIHKITNTKQSVVVYGLEGDKKYTVHFAFKVAGKVKYMSKSLSTTMPKYDRLINVLLADRREIKVQFNAPADQNYRYLIMDKVTYFGLRGFGAGDADLLEYGEVAKGPQVVSRKDGFELIIEGDTVRMVVKPFTTYVVLYAECDSTGEIIYDLVGGGGDDGGMDPLMSGSIQKPIIREYTEECTDDWYELRDLYAKAEIATASALVGEGEFIVTGAPTEYRAKFNITPPESVKRYGAAIFPKSVLINEVYPVVGQEGSLSYVMEYLTQPVAGPVELEFKNLQKDTVYVMMLIGICDDNGETQIVYSKEFTAMSSTKPASELVVTQVEAPDKSPYHIYFNVKAPKKDCTGGLYLMNYTKEWVLKIKDPVTHESLTYENGQKLTPDEVRLINSESGLQMRFTSWEDTESLLSLISFNADEKGKNFITKGRSIAEPAKERVESDLFTKLLGTWDVSYTAKVGTGAVQEYKFKTTIAGEPAKASSTFAPGDKQYTALHKFYKNQAIQKGKTPEEADAIATAEIDKQFAEYKVSQAKYAKKYRDQNLMVMGGFAYNGYTGVKYSSPWDLFCNTTYHSYDNDQLFYDYGSKLFLEVKKDANGAPVLSMETNAINIAPFSNCTYNSFVAGAIELSNSYMYLTGSYPVTIVDDNTLIIKATIKIDGNDIPFMTAYTANGATYSVHSYATKDIVLKRAAAPAKAPANFYNSNNDEPYVRPSFEFKRTRLHGIVAERSSIELNVCTGIDKSQFEKAAKKIVKR